MTDKLKHLQHKLSLFPQCDYPVHSRIHKLRSFNFPSTYSYVKRDDELGFGISGSKTRKYRSLIPYLIAHDIGEVVVIGSAYSNHVLSFIQILIENGIAPTLFLKGDPNRAAQGNALLTSLFVDPSSIQWFSQPDWKNIESIAHAYAAQQNHPVYVLPEGGFTAAALPGALTLPLDILANEQTEKIRFDHIFIEAGTGFMASALILGLSWLEHPTQIHVVLLADDEEAFLKRFKLCHDMFSTLIEANTPLPSHFSLHRPQLSKGFGEINRSLFENIVQIARQEGFLSDPIYSAKLFIESKNLIFKKKIEGKVLIHHSGGSLTLMGFQQQIHQAMYTSPN